jgi:uncharacterized DUF497 family protein
MFQFSIIWDLEDDPDGNLQHCADHGVTPDDVDDVLQSSKSQTRPEKRFNNRWETIGLTREGRLVSVIWDQVVDDPLTIKPVTAFEVGERRKGRR